MTTFHMPTPEERIAASKRMKARFGNPEIDAETLRRLYWDEGMNLSEVADAVGFHNRETVHFWMEKYGIPRRNRSEARIGRPRNYHLSDEEKHAQSERKKEWHRQHPEFRERLRSISKRPTRVESRIIALAEKYNLPLKYVGDRQFWIGNKYDHTVRNPDFIRTDDRKECVEIFGERWHSPLYKPKTPYKYTLEGTMEHYKKNGWTCTVMWDYEVKQLSDEAIARMLVPQSCWN